MPFRALHSWTLAFPTSPLIFMLSCHIPDKRGRHWLYTVCFLYYLLMCNWPRLPQPITDSPNLMPPVSSQRKLHRYIKPQSHQELWLETGDLVLLSIQRTEVPTSTTSGWSLEGMASQEPHMTAMMTEQWFSEFRVHLRHLEHLSQHRLLCPTPRIADSVSLRYSLRIAFLKSFRWCYCWSRDQTLKTTVIVSGVGTKLPLTC